MARARPARDAPSVPARPRHGTSQRRARAARLWHDTVAVSPVIGTVLILAISAVGVAAVMTWGIPSLQQTQVQTEFAGIEEQFRAVDHITESVMRGGAVGKASAAKLTIPTGTLRLANDTLMAVAWHPHNVEVVDPDRFWLTGLDDATPNTFAVAGVAGQNPGDEGQYVLVHRMRGIEQTEVQTEGFEIVDGRPIVEIDVGSDDSIFDAPTRVRVMQATGSTSAIVMEAWIMPLGSLEYSRQAPYGVIGVRLENSVVIREMETGNFLTNRPLVNLETDSADDVQFFAIFAHRLVDDDRYPGISSGGGGSYPLLFSLSGNHLRTTGDSVYRVAITMTGDRADLWETHYKDAYGFVDSGDLDHDGLVLLAGTDGVGSPKPFDFVLMETNVEAFMKLDFQDLGITSN